MLGNPLHFYYLFARCLDTTKKTGIIKGNNVCITRYKSAFYEERSIQEGETRIYNMKKFIESQLSNWTKQEITWLLSATAIILALSLYWQESLIGITSSLCGVLCVVLVGKGKISNYFFGIINVTLYAFIAYEAKYFGDAMLNLCYYLPMNFIGFFLWKKNLDSGTGEVVRRQLNKKTASMLFAGSGCAVLLYGLFLRSLGGNLPFVDSISTVFSVVAQFLCVIRMTEQWIFWIVVNVVSIGMWVIAFSEGGDGIATLLMWCVYLINSVIMWRAWMKEAHPHTPSARVEV